MKKIRVLFTLLIFNFSLPALHSQDLQQMTFNYTGAIITWTVPSCIRTLTITAIGGQGGWNTLKKGSGGKGATMSGVFDSTSGIFPGKILAILVAQCPGNTTGLPGGGGGSFIALGANIANDTLLIAAGGGGGGFNSAGIGADTTNAATGSKPGRNGNGGYVCSCGGGGGGFLSAGQADSSYKLPGGMGFRQGGKGGCASYQDSLECSCGQIQCGGFGGGSCADFIDYCNVHAGAGGGYNGGSGVEYPASIPYYNWPLVEFGNAGGSYNTGVNQNNIPDNNTGDGRVIITYNTPYTLSISASLHSLIQGDSTLLTVASNDTSATFSWQPALSVTHPNDSVTYAHPLANTTYTISVHTPCGILTDTVTVFVNAVNSIKESTVAKPAALTVIPNPNNGVFTLQMDNGQWTMDNDKIEIYNIYGQEIAPFYLPPYGGSTTFSYNINMGSEPNGVYFYRLLKEDGSVVGSGKVIIVK